MTPDSQLFSAGPPLVKDAIGEDVTKEELGGPQVHVETSGVAHNRPPCASMIERQIDNPMPMPPGFVVKNELNIRSAFSGSMPVPESCIATRT